MWEAGQGACPASHDGIGPIPLGWWWIPAAKWEAQGGCRNHTHQRESVSFVQGSSSDLETTSGGSLMGNRNRPSRMERKPKKDAKVKTIVHEEPPPMVVEVVKRKRKEQRPDDE